MPSTQITALGSGRLQVSARQTKKKRLREPESEFILTQLSKPAKEKVPEGVEPSLAESESAVMTVRPWNRLTRYGAIFSHN
ncbi:hypothetical protein E5D57_000260 [Metarhizium anisopliae]|nr:hypothetical protein E5D57_000260 [Metarhizium anisopliae]